MEGVMGYISISIGLILWAMFAEGLGFRATASPISGSIFIVGGMILLKMDAIKKKIGEENIGMILSITDAINENIKSLVELNKPLRKKSK
jgi:hypothetical protein